MGDTKSAPGPLAVAPHGEIPAPGSGDAGLAEPTPRIALELEMSACIGAV